MSTDRETTHRVRSWLEAGVTELPDRVLDAVLDQVPTTRQRRPFWPGRRDGSMNSYLRLGGLAAAVVVLAIAGTALMLSGGISGPSSAPTAVPSAGVPTGQPPATGPAATSAAVLAEFTACVPPNSMLKEGTNTTETITGPFGDVTFEKARGTTYRGTITATDPRFSGTHYYIWTGNSYTLAASGAQGPGSFAEGHRIENEDGAWAGSSYGIGFTDDTFVAGPVILAGEGAYEGLSAVLVNADYNGACFFEFRGIVMEVPEPPVPYTGR